MFKTDKQTSSTPQKIRKMTKTRLQNIAIYYLERFDSSSANLCQVLKRRVFDYARQVPDFNIAEAESWIEEIIARFENLGYLNDKRYAEFKIDNYLLSGKPERYIRQKMQQKGINGKIIDDILSNREFDEEAMALRFAAKKRIGPYRTDESARRENRQKDLAAIVRAGFSYDTAQKIIGAENIDDFA